MSISFFFGAPRLLCGRHITEVVIYLSNFIGVKLFRFLREALLQ